MPVSPAKSLNIHLRRPGKTVGVDVGIHHLLATSENEVVENPRWYRAEQRKLRVIQRRVARRKKGGSHRRKAVLELQRQHLHIANSRKDYLDKQIYHLIVNYDVIALEDLHIHGMVRNRSPLEKHLGCRLGLSENAPCEQSGRSWPTGHSGGPCLHIQNLLFVRYGV